VGPAEWWVRVHQGVADPSEHPIDPRWPLNDAGDRPAAWFRPSVLSVKQWTARSSDRYRTI
jgi:hypothetical protein